MRYQNWNIQRRGKRETNGAYQLNQQLSQGTPRGALEHNHSTFNLMFDQQDGWLLIYDMISRVRSRDIETNRDPSTSQRTTATALRLITTTYLESHVLPHSDWFINSLEGCGKRINHIYGGVITLVTGTRRLSKRGKEMLLAMRTGRLHTPVEIPTKKPSYRPLPCPIRLHQLSSSQCYPMEQFSPRCLP